MSASYIGFILVGPVKIDLDSVTDNARRLFMESHARVSKSDENNWWDFCAQFDIDERTKGSPDALYNVSNLPELVPKFVSIWNAAENNLDLLCSVLYRKVEPEKIVSAGVYSVGDPMDGDQGVIMDALAAHVVEAAGIEG